jgi:hypothetical protein
MSEIRLNFSIDTDEHPELVCLDTGGGRRGSRSAEVIRLLKLGAKADAALRELMNVQIAHAAQAGMLSDQSVARPLAPAPVPAASLATVPPAAAAPMPVTTRRPPAPPTEPVAPPVQQTAGVSGKSRAQAFLG